MPSTLWQIALTYAIPVVATIFFISLIRNRFNSLRDIPGPPLAAYTILWRLWNVCTGRSHLTIIDFHRKYGSLVRIGPNVVSVGDPAMIPIIYSVKGDFAKTAMYPISSITWQGKVELNLFSMTDENEHREQKKKAAGAYTLESLLKMEDAVDNCGRLFLDRMGQFADRRESVDLTDWIQYYTFDVLGEVTFAQRFGFLETGADVDGTIAILDLIIVYFAVVGLMPALHSLLLGNPLLGKLFPQLETQNSILMFTLKVMRSRVNIKEGGELDIKEDVEIGHDMLSKWAAVQSRDPLKMNTKDALVFLTGNVLAGSDTTSITIRAVLYYLIKNPSKMAQARVEIDNAFSTGELSNPIKDVESRNHLPYVNACIKEALRLHPAIGFMLERYVPPGGATICGKYLPGGTIVGINPWVLQYDHNVFPQPEAFEPERWLTNDEESLKMMEKSFLAFGAGSRVCIGKNIAMIQLRKMAPQLLREFEIDFAGGKEEEWNVSCFSFVQQKMPKCVLRRR